MYKRIFFILGFYTQKNIFFIKKNNLYTKEIFFYKIYFYTISQVMSESSNGDAGPVDEDLDANPNKRDSEKKRRDQVEGSAFALSPENLFKVQFFLEKYEWVTEFRADYPNFRLIKLGLNID